MSDLIVVAFNDDATAFELRAELAKLQKDYLLEMDDIVVVTHDQNGKVKLHQAVNMTAAGAATGSLWGLLVGVLFLNPILGVAVGAGAGALSGAFTDIGIDDKVMKEIGETLTPGTAAVFALIRSATADKVMTALEPFRAKGKIIRTSLSNESEQRLKDFFERSQAEPPALTS